MKHTITIFLSLFLFITCVSQTPGTSTTVDRLYKEVVSYDRIEFRNIGCWGNLSRFYPKVDSLFDLSPKTSCLTYFDDTSHILKYYAFMNILFILQDDSIAYNKLASVITDSARVFNEWHFGKPKFNELLIANYYFYLKSKYYWGGQGTNHMFVYIFPKPDKKEFKRKLKDLHNLMRQNKLDESLIASYRS